MCISDKTEICPFVHIIIIHNIIITRTASHTTKYIHQRCNLPIGQAIGSTQISVCVPVEMIHMHTYTGKGASENHNTKHNLHKNQVKLAILKVTIYCRRDVSLKMTQQ